VPTRDLVIVFTGDEETEMATTQDLVNQHRDLLDAEYALNADGGGGTLEEDRRAADVQLPDAEKTYADFELTVHNPAATARGRAPTTRSTSSPTPEESAGVQFPTHVERHHAGGVRRGGQGRTGRTRRGDARVREEPARYAAAVTALTRAHGADRAHRDDVRRDDAARRHAKNALAAVGDANINCRIFPGVAIDARAEDACKSRSARPWKSTTIDHPTASDASPLRPDVMDAVTRAVHVIHPGVQVVPNQASGASDGLYFRAAGIPTYGVGGMFIEGQRLLRPRAQRARAGEGVL
jgi:acetylornithine deacetylase/succinyl-diaminopimelate desuccinylase-like protein